MRDSLLVLHLVDGSETLRNVSWPPLGALRGLRRSGHLPGSVPESHNRLLFGLCSS
jgi:hypothetical protein